MPIQQASDALLDFEYDSPKRSESTKVQIVGKTRTTIESEDAKTKLQVRPARDTTKLIHPMAADNVDAGSDPEHTHDRVQRSTPLVKFVIREGSHATTPVPRV